MRVSGLGSRFCDLAAITYRACGLGSRGLFGGYLDVDEAGVEEEGGSGSERAQAEALQEKEEQKLLRTCSDRV
eukprot:2273338-Rhodomonas_salina.2